MDERWDHEEGPAEAPAVETWIKRPLSPALIVLTLVVMVGWFVHASLYEDDILRKVHGSRLLYAIVRTVSAVILSLLVAGFVYLVSGKSAIAARRTYGVVIVISLLGSMMRMERAAEQAQGSRGGTQVGSLAADAEFFFEAMVAGPSAGSKACREVAEAWERASAVSRDEVALAGRVLARFLRQLSESGLEYESAQGAWIAIQESHLGNEGDVDVRSRALGRLEAASRPLVELQTTGTARLQSVLLEAGVPQPARARCQKEFSAAQPLIEELWRVRFEYFAATRETLLLLARNPGHWEADATTGSMAFDNQDLQKQHESLLARRSATEAAITIAAERLNERRRKRIRARGE